MPLPLTHLLFTTLADPYDPASEGGIPCALRLALERRVERVSVFRPGPPLRHPLELMKRLLRGEQRHPLAMTVPALKRTAKQVREEIVRVRPEAVLSLGSPPVAYLERREQERPAPLKIPLFLFDDAPWLARRQAYERWQAMPAWGARFAEDEARAARQLDGLCFGSRWACDEALRIYSQSGTRRDLRLSERIYPVPLGAVRTPEMGRDELLLYRQQRAASELLELLFVSNDRDWMRHGGPLAVEVARQMRQLGRPVRLHIAGCRPRLPETMTGEGGFVSLHGDEAACPDLLLQAHLLLQPALAECRGTVFVEAQAFALPSIARVVDALPSVIVNGVTGLLLPESARASVYVERLLALWDDREAYLAMAGRARERFEAELNWDRTAAAIVEAIERRR
jgi:glycosyltransferase involved in cell wall biosynthesis